MPTPTQSLIYGMGYFGFGLLALCLSLAVLSVIPDAAYFPNPFCLLFAVQTIASCISLIVIVAPIPVMIAMGTPHFLHYHFTSAPGLIFSTLLFLIVALQILISIRRVARVWSERLIDAFYERFPYTVHAQTLLAFLYAFTIIVVINSISRFSFFDIKKYSWNFADVEWKIVHWSTIVFGSLLTLLNLPTVKLLLVRRRRLPRIRPDMVDEDELVQWRISYESLYRHMVADGVLLLVFAYPLPSDLLECPLLSLFRSILLPLWPILSTVYCSVTLRVSMAYRLASISSFGRGGGGDSSAK